MNSLAIGINGFGRIGRCVLWAIHARGLADKLRVARINDPGDIDTLRLLTRFDTTHGRSGLELQATEDGFRCAGVETRFSRSIEAADIDWSGIDLVMECSGRNPDKARALAHLNAGAPRVQIGAPAGQDMPLTLVWGVNDQDLTPEHTHWSLGSCTTNCLGVTLKALQNLSIQSGTYTTIHSYTNDQKLVDVAHSDPRRARAAAQSMVPTTTNALQALEWVMPKIAGRIEGYSMRVPTLNVSCVDMTLSLAEPISTAALNQLFRDAANGPLSGLLDVNDEPLVSVDFTTQPASAIVDLGLTQSTGNLVRVVSWYDNEWGYANRMVDTALKVLAFKEP